MTTTQMNEYQLNGYANRREYLESLCEEYDRTIVYTLSLIHISEPTRPY